MITTISKQGGRRYPQMGSTGQPWAGILPGVGETTQPVSGGDTHDGGPWRRRKDTGAAERARRFKEENEQRRRDLLLSLKRVTGIDLEPEAPVEQILAAVDQKIVKPKRPKERELAKMAQNMRAFLRSMEAFDREAIEREREEEDFVVLSLLGRTLH